MVARLVRDEEAAGSNPVSPTIVISQEIRDSRTCGTQVRLLSFGSVGLVVTGWVDGELAQEFAGDRVDDADLEVLDEHQDVGSLVGSPGAGS